MENKKIKRKKLVIGITGGTGCGQSTVCRILEKYGAKVVDADRIAREATQNSPRIFTKLQERYGERVFDSWGNLMRRELARIVFTDETEKVWLNRLVHPEVIAEIQKEKKEFYQFSTHPFLVVDAALIFEAGLEKEFDRILVVTASLPVRIRRILERDKITDEEAMNRIQSQMPIEEKERRADDILRNENGLIELEEQIRKWMESLGLKSLPA